MAYQEKGIIISQESVENLAENQRIELAELLVLRFLEMPDMSLVEFRRIVGELGLVLYINWPCLSQVKGL